MGERSFYDREMTDVREGLERSLSEEIVALSATGQRLTRTFALGNSLHDTDFRALAYIHLSDLSGEHVTPALLGAHLSLSSAAVTYVVDRLERAGHVERVPDARDGRRVILRYADPGRVLTRQFFGGAELHHHNALAGFADDEIAVAQRVLSALNSAFLVYHDELREWAPEDPDGPDGPDDPEPSVDGEAVNDGLAPEPKSA